MSYWISPEIYLTSQNTVENYSNVRVDLYFDRDSGSAWSNYTTYGYIIVDGQRQDFSVASYGTSSRAYLATKDFRVYHNTDGTKAVSLECYYNADNLPYVGELSTSGTHPFPTIARAAPITSANYSQIYNPFNVTYSSYSSQFNYKLRVSIPQVISLETYSNYISGSNKAFTVERQKYLTEYLLKNNKASADLGFVIETYSGSTKIGESNESITAFTKPSESILTGFSMSNIDTSVTFGISKTSYWSYYDHVLTIQYGNLILYNGAYTTSVTITDSDRLSNLYTAMKGTISGTFTATLTTKYGSNTIGTHQKMVVGALVNIEPTLTGALTYYDGNSTVTNVTGNNQIIVQGKSTVIMKIPGYTLKKNAEVLEYKAYMNGTSYTVTPNGLLNLGVLSGAGAVTVSISLIDSRGKSITTSCSFSVTGYTNPILSWDYHRCNSSAIKDLLGGKYAYIKPVFSVASIAGNTIKSTSLKIGGTVVSNNLISGVGVSYGGNYEINKSYPLEITIVDKLGGSTTLTGALALAELPMNITKDKTGIAFGTIAINNQITLGKSIVTKNEFITNGVFNQGVWNTPKTGALTQIIDNSGAQHSVIVGKDASGNRHYGIDLYDNTSSRTMRLYAGANYLEIGTTPTFNGSKVLTLDSAFPVESIYLTYANTNPGNFLGGSWTLIGHDRHIIGAGSSYAGGSQGGSNITGGTALSEAQNGRHQHHLNNMMYYGDGAGTAFMLANGGAGFYASNVVGTSGSGDAHAHSITPFYIALYIWRRVA